MTNLTRRDWVPADAEEFVMTLATEAAKRTPDEQETEIDRLIGWNREIHERDCINLNPATNVMNPKAEAALSSGIGSRPSLGYPGDKYEMGLEAIERIEVIAAELAAEIFNVKYAEIRVASGALSNLYAFMATCKPGDSIIAPAPAIGGHVTHHDAGAAGLYGLKIHPAPVDPARYTVDLEALRKQAREIRPKLITIGGSLNLRPHPVAEIRRICDEVGAHLLFDAAHLCGMIAGKTWPNPLDEGAHLMTMSTYKSLGGPAGGLIVTNDADLAERLDRIAFPGLTANFDAAKSASLALALLDWKQYGEAYAKAMVDTSRALASALREHGVPVFSAGNELTTSHQFAIKAAAYGGGQAAAKTLRRANILTCGIGLPIDPVDGDMNGLRFGTPEIVRWGMGVADMESLADLIARALEDPDGTLRDATLFRHRFQDLHYIRK